MRECDLIMRGGVTSGVVYPKAIEEISKSYRLRDIGGTSAGAIAAVLAAAAEYRRQEMKVTPNLRRPKNPFETIGSLSEELADVLSSLFQPHRQLAPIFDVLMLFLAGKHGFGAVLRAAGRLIMHLWAPIVLGIAIGIGWVAITIAIFGEPQPYDEIFWAVVIFRTFLSAAFISLIWLVVLVFVALPRHNFGLCPGISQGNGRPGVTDWIADQIDRVANGLKADDPLGGPLLVGDLRRHNVRIAMMTTDLSSGRPYQLPFQVNCHYFSYEEFSHLFPKRVIDVLVGSSRPLAAVDPEMRDDLYPLPIGDHMPLVVVARLSLSFPILIQAVPLYRHRNKEDEASGNNANMVRCLFSDGGITSNFPIHFFDAFIPRRPTFGISLGQLSSQGAYAGPSVEKKEMTLEEVNERLVLYQGPVNPVYLPTRTIKGLVAFFLGIVDTAKDWQDTLQSGLPGYAERIIEVRLNKDEGGLNLSMSKATVLRLGNLGREAGRQLVAEFDFDAHRFKRAFTVLSELQEGLGGFARAYNTPAAHFAQYSNNPEVKGGLAYPALLAAGDAATDISSDPEKVSQLLSSFADEVQKMGAPFVTDEADPKLLTPMKDQALSTLNAKLRLVADADTKP